MIEPPSSLSKLKELYDSGVNEIGINIEIWDRKIAKRIMPGKAETALDDYLEVLKYCRNLWSERGAVRSILLVGLEPIQNTLEAVRRLSELGVMPILSPFRPVPGTELENYPSVDQVQQLTVWNQAKKICEEFDVPLGPTCIGCQNNTITLPFGDKYKYY